MSKDKIIWNEDNFRLPETLQGEPDEQTITVKIHSEPRELPMEDDDQQLIDDDWQWAEQQENEDFAQDGELDNIDQEDRL